MRPDLQQPETNSTPFVISKTNSNEMVENHWAEVRSQQRQIAPIQLGITGGSSTSKFYPKNR